MKKKQLCGLTLCVPRFNSFHVYSQTKEYEERIWVLPKILAYSVKNDVKSLISNTELLVEYWILLKWPRSHGKNR